DALEELDVSRSLVQAILHKTRSRSPSGEVVGTLDVDPSALELGEPRAIFTASSNTTLQYGERLFLKAFRRLEDGVHPDLDVGRFLAKHAPGLTPRVVGALELRQSRGSTSTLAVLQEFVPNEGTAWELTRRELGRFYERILTRPYNEMTP